MTNSSGDEVGMIAMGGIPVAAVEDANDVVAHGGKGFVEADEAMFIIDLWSRWLASFAGKSKQTAIGAEN